MMNYKQLTSDPLCWVRFYRHGAASIEYSRYGSDYFRYTQTQLAAMLGCTKACGVDLIAIGIRPSMTEAVLKEMLDLMNNPPPQPTFPVGTLVLLFDTHCNRGQYGTVVVGTFTSENNIYVRVPGEETIDYSPVNLRIVSEREFSRNVTLQVGDTVRLRPGSGYTYEWAKIRSISGGQLTVEFDNYDAVRALNHEHEPGEPYGHVCTLTRKWLELAGQPRITGVHLNIDDI